MAISAYTGLMGSGKTYEVVSSVILGAVRSGRRVVTNISGLCLDEIRAYLIEQGRDPATLGTVVVVPHERIEQPGFFPSDAKSPDENAECVVQAGDLVAVDEIWRFWGVGAKIKPEHMAFFRMHRHFVGAAGVACDVVLICQDISDVDRKLKVVVEQLFRMSKLKAIGAPKRYRVDVYAGHKVTREPIRQIQNKYDPAVFALYSSYSQSQSDDGKAKESVVDGRGNLFGGAFFKVVLPLVFIGGVVGVWQLYRFFTAPPPKSLGGTVASADQPSQNKPGDVVKAGPVETGSKKSPDDLISDKWRLIGMFGKDEFTRLAVLEDGDGRVRYVRPGFSSVTGIGWVVSFGGADPQIATTWGGPVVNARGGSSRQQVKSPLSSSGGGS